MRRLFVVFVGFGCLDILWLGWSDCCARGPWLGCCLSGSTVRTGKREAAKLKSVLVVLGLNRYSVNKTRPSLGL